MLRLDLELTLHDAFKVAGSFGGSSSSIAYDDLSEAHSAHQL
jgi:hypothetical protein